MFKIGTAKTGHIRQTAGSGENEFALLFRRPTHEERLQDQAYYTTFSITKSTSDLAAQARFRMGFIEGWEGVIDQDGQSVPFKLQTLQEAFAADQRFASAVYLAMDQAFARSSDEDALKN